MNCSCGIVAKWKQGPYTGGREETSWVKIRNREYSQWGERRERMFDRPDVSRKVMPGAWEGGLRADDTVNRCVMPHRHSIRTMTEW